MFNQKINHFIHENPSYLNTSSGAAMTRAEQIHRCGTNINTYKLAEDCGSLPLQTWCYKDVAVESFAMRPIVNSKEYYDNIKNYLKGVVDADHPLLNSSGLNKETYTLINDYGQEPLGSFLQMIKLDVLNTLNVIMGNSASNLKMFNSYDPLKEGFVIIDIDITPYKSTSNDNHYYHNVVFSAVNTTRYNTISFKSSLYQDTTGVMNNWNKSIEDVQNSKDVPKDLHATNTYIYIYDLSLLNDVECVLGTEEQCKYLSYSFDKSTDANEQLINKNNTVEPVENIWLKPTSLADNTYAQNGTYDVLGNIKIEDSGPENLDNLIKELTVYDNQFRQF